MKRIFFIATIIAAFMMTACDEQQTANQQAETSFSEVIKTRRSVRNFDASETVMAVIALGYRAEEPNRPVRKDLDEVVRFF